MIVKTDDIHYKNIVKAMANTDIGISWMPSEYPDGLLPSEMPQAIFDLAQQSYNSGYDMGGQVGVATGYKRGKEDGIIEGIAQGKQAEYDKFWDAFQDHGWRKDYQGGFYGAGWNDNTFTPKYDIKNVTNTSSMFTAAQITNLEEALQRAGVILDTSTAVRVDNMFYYSTTRVVPEIDATNSKNITSIFNYAYKLHTVRKLKLPDNATFGFTNAFLQATELENIVIEGSISASGFDIHWSTKLSKESMRSIINALSSTTSGLSVTLSKTAVDNAFTGGSEGDEWLNLIATKNNWTITLAER